VRITRTLLWASAFAAMASACQSFPEDPAQRAGTVCRPLHWALRTAVAVASAMNDRGHLGPTLPPWHEDAHRSCLRIAERVFMATSE